MFWTEEWSDYPQSKKYVLDLLEKDQTPGVIFLTGDKHFGAMTQRNNLVEVMSSGMTHTAPRIFHPISKKKV